MGASRYDSNPDPSICNHPNMSQYTHQDSQGNPTIVAYCPSCGAEWQ